MTTERGSAPPSDAPPSSHRRAGDVWIRRSFGKRELADAGSVCDHQPTGALRYARAKNATVMPVVSNKVAARTALAGARRPICAPP